MNALREILTRIAPLGESEWGYISARFKPETVRKNSVLLAKGAIEGHLYFIEQGVLRTWVERGDREITIEFSFEHTLFSAYTSFVTRMPSDYHVSAITDMVVWKIGYRDLQDIYENTKTGQQIGRIATENLYNEKCRREISLLTQSAERRYSDLFTQQPRLIREIPLKYIASFIGVTPQALSRIRKRIS